MIMAQDERGSESVCAVVNQNCGSVIGDDVGLRIGHIYLLTLSH